MRKETIDPQEPRWSLQRIPVAPPAVRPFSTIYGVTLTEIEFGKDKMVTTGSRTGYPYVSMKK